MLRFCLISLPEGGCGLARPASGKRQTLPVSDGGASRRDSGALSPSFEKTTTQKNVAPIHCANGHRSASGHFSGSRSLCSGYPDRDGPLFIWLASFGGAESTKFRPHYIYYGLLRPVAVF